MANLDNIHELTKLFQQFGGKFENAEVRYNEEAGYHCYSLNGNKNTLISCPANLLVDVNDIDINEEGLFITEPDKYGDEIAFLNKYVKFHFNKNVVAHHSEIKQQIKSLPEKDLSLISRIFPPALLDLNKYSGLDYEKKCIINSHNIKHLDRKVIMPFVSFINYSKNGLSFNNRADNISISGKFHNEILAKYNDDDVLSLASGYNFITDTKYIYSVPITYPMINGKKLIIKRDVYEGIELGNGRWGPAVKISQDSVSLSWFPLYLEGAPMYPSTIAGMIAAEINIPAENLIFNILKLNLHALIPAAFQLTNSENEFSRYLGAATQRQLETIAECR